MVIKIKFIKILFTARFIIIFNQFCRYFFLRLGKTKENNEKIIFLNINEVKWLTHRENEHNF